MTGLCFPASHLPLPSSRPHLLQLKGRMSLLSQRLHLPLGRRGHLALTWGGHIPCQSAGASGPGRRWGCVCRRGLALVLNVQGGGQGGMDRHLATRA